MTMTSHPDAWKRTTLEDANGYRVLEAVPGTFAGQKSSRLIAAAPELLGALRGLLDRLEYEEKSLSGEHDARALIRRIEEGDAP